MRILLLTLLFLSCLAVEKLVHRRRLRPIALRIAITGTRGKSSVTRMLASVLRESGRRVLAKTTGSQPCWILPDGTECEIPRRAPPSILEQKRLVAKARALGADTLVAEMMSVHAECHRVESAHLLAPAVVAVTNVRRDHLEAMGETEEEAAAVFRLAVPPAARLFVPADTARHFAGRQPTETVAAGACAPLLALDPGLRAREFTGDLDLVYAVARHLGIPDGVILEGIRKTRHDLGRMRIWRWPCAGGTCYLVNAFAANDPDSTWRALARAGELVPDAAGTVGILNLRADRPDRSRQWLEELEGGALAHFDALFVAGAHAGPICRRLRGVRALPGRWPPERIMAAVADRLQDRFMVFGFGNMAGAGRALVTYWAGKGEAYVL